MVLYDWIGYVEETALPYTTQKHSSWLELFTSKAE